MVGTEVPVPGSAHETLGELRPTEAGYGRGHDQAHRRAFTLAKLDAASRGLSAVVHPGVEFDHYKVIDFLPERIGSSPHDAAQRMVYEAHSTDYQTSANLRDGARAFRS